MNRRLISLWMLLMLLVLPLSPALGQARIVAGTTGKPLPKPLAIEPEFRIAILPDRTTGQPWGLPYLERAVEDLNRIQPHAVFTVGDMVQGYTRSIEDYRAQVREYFGIISALDAPFYPLPGNHDVISGDRNSDDHRFEKEYRTLFGPMYYSVEFDLATCVSLYSDEELKSRPTLSDEQIEWALLRFDEALTRDRPLVIMMHKPLWRYRDSGWDRLHERLADLRAGGIKVIVVAGHFHSMQREPDKDGVEYHLVGTCGALVDQHPLGGQLQHITMLHASSTGETQLYHQPVGCTLPDDFILAEDQNRTFRLKSAKGSFVMETVLEQPVRVPLRDTVRLRIKNPIDVPITVSGGLAKTEPMPTAVPGYFFAEQTQLDTFNAHVMRTDTPFEQVNDVEPITLAPGETGYLEIELRCEAQPSPLPPPQINMVARFTDSRGREVPVFIRRRLPLKLEYVLGDSTSIDMPICAWEFSVYDHNEPDPQLGLFVNNGRLCISLLSFDDANSFELMDDDTDRVNNPKSDAVRLRFGSGANERVYLIEPFGPEGLSWRCIPGKDDRNRSTWTLQKTTDVQWQLLQGAEGAGWGVVASLPLTLVGQPGESIAFNLEVADNDVKYHTQWRQWSAPRAGSIIVLPNRFQ